MSLAVMIAGCDMSDGYLARQSAGPTGCPPDDITIANRSGYQSHTAQSWTATCNGVAYQCSKGASDAALCSKMSEASEESSASDEPTVAEVQPQREARPEIKRERDHEGRWVLHMTLPSGPLSLEIASEPANDREHIIVAFGANVPVDAEGCQVKILVDSEVFGFQTKEVRSLKGHLFRTVVDDAFFKRMLASKELAARVCGVEWRPSTDDRKMLADYQHRFDEEIKWAASQPAPAEDTTGQGPAGTSETPGPGQPPPSGPSAP